MQYRCEPCDQRLRLIHDLAPRHAQHAVAECSQLDVAPPIALERGARRVVGEPVDLDNEPPVAPRKSTS
jgi:hypothetical protein